MPPAPESPPGYGGPVPPGGWQQPMAMQQPGWAGRQLAGWWSRVGATLLDGLILFIPVVALTFIAIAAFAGNDAAGWVVVILGALAYVVAAIFYAPVLMARGGRNNGQTFGKQIVGIQVVRDSGEPFGLGYGFLREIVVKNLLFQGVGSFFLSIPTLLDWLWPLWDDQNRCLHDMVVSTHVVRT
jgi:uncharacterized RDD family membrane protein YckC